MGLPSRYSWFELPVAVGSVVALQPQHIPQFVLPSHHQVSKQHKELRGRHTGASLASAAEGEEVKISIAALRKQLWDLHKARAPTCGAKSVCVVLDRSLS